MQQYWAENDYHITLWDSLHMSVHAIYIVTDIILSPNRQIGLGHIQYKDGASYYKKASHVLGFFRHICNKMLNLGYTPHWVWVHTVADQCNHIWWSASILICEFLDSFWSLTSPGTVMERSMLSKNLRKTFTQRTQTSQMQTVSDMGPTICFSH